MSTLEPHQDYLSGQREIGLSHLELGKIWLSRLALAALGAIAILAFFAPSVSLPDRMAFLPLGLAMASFWIPSLLRRVSSHREASTFILTAAMFLIYSLARSVGPDEGFELRFAALPDDSFVVPYSAYIVVFSTLITGPFWWQRKNEWTRSIVGAVTIIAILTLGSFTLLRSHFPTGPAEILDPAPLPTLAMKLIEYGCVALLCHAVTALKETRCLALRLLPGALLVLWARHQFFVAPEESGAE